MKNLLVSDHIFFASSQGRRSYAWSNWCCWRWLCPIRFRGSVLASPFRLVHDSLCTPSAHATHMPVQRTPEYSTCQVRHVITVLIILWVSNQHFDWSTNKRYLFAIQYGGLVNFRPGFVHKIVNISLVWGRSTQSDCLLETQRIIKA